MKRMLAFAMCLLVFAAIIRGQGGPGTLELTIRLVDDGPDVSAQFRTYVGFVPDGKSGPPTLGNIQIIRPNVADQAVYTVPSDKDIGIFVLSRGVPAYQSLVDLNPGQHLAYDFVLNAGIVQVTTQRTPDTGSAHIWFVGPDGQFDPNDQFVDGTQFVVPAGTQVFQAGQSLEAVRDSIDVIAGQTHALKIINEIGTLMVTLKTAIEFEYLSPIPILQTVGGRKNLQTGDNPFDGGRWQFGTYDTEISLSYRFGRPVRSMSVATGPIVIDQAANAVTLPLPLMGVAASFTDWRDPIPDYAMAMIVSISDPGLPFATYRVEQDHAYLMFIPPDERHDFAVALVSDDQVLGLHPIGLLSPDILKTVAVPAGGDAGLCRQIMPDFGCDRLGP